MKTTFTLAVAAAIAVSAGAASARDQIRIVGSSTVFPYTQAVVEEFGNTSGFASPILESTGTGGGMKIFCEGIGANFADVTGASRAMKASEYALCAKNGVTDISEALIGYDGLSIAVSRGSKSDWALTLEQIYLALAAEVPVGDGWGANPNKKWSDIDASLPDVEIVAYGPPPTSGTRDAFVELAMHEGCKRLPYVKNGGFDGKWVTENCSRMRQDGPFVEAGENDNLIVQRIEADPNALGIFGYSFLYENEDKLTGVPVDGISPSADTIADFSYPIARPLFVYVKNAHRGVIPGLNEFLAEYVSDRAMSADGYLVERGLVPLSPQALAGVQNAVLNAENMAAPK